MPIFICNYCYEAFEDPRPKRRYCPPEVSNCQKEAVIANMPPEYHARVYRKKEKLEECICKRCGLTWQPYKKDPRQCPNCHSYKWQEDTKATLIAKDLKEYNTAEGLLLLGQENEKLKLKNEELELKLEALKSLLKGV